MTQKTADAIARLKEMIGDTTFTKKEIVGVSYSTLRKYDVITDAFEEFDHTETMDPDTYDDWCSCGETNYVPIKTVYNDDSDTYILNVYRYVYKFK